MSPKCHTLYCTRCLKVFLERCLWYKFGNHITIPFLGDSRWHQFVKDSENSCSKESCFLVVPKLKQVPLLRNSKSFIYPSQKRECESRCLLTSAIEPYFLVHYLFSFTKHHGSTEHNLRNADSECLRPMTWERQSTNVLDLSSSTRFSITPPTPHQPL